MHMKVSPIIWKLNLSCKTLRRLYETDTIGVGAAGRGGSAPTTRAMPGCCTRPDYDSFHEYRQLQSILYLTYSSFLHCYNQETLVYLSQVQTLASLMQKWVCFLRNVGVVQKFSRAMRAINILCPHNVQHLPTPLDTAGNNHLVP